MGKTGLDGSPGNELSALAMRLIESLEETIFQKSWEALALDGKDQQ